MVGDNTILVDENGKQVSGYDYSEDPSTVKGTKEYRTRIKQDTTLIKDQLNEMRESFDVIPDAEGATKTDILPATSAGKIAEWAADQKVDPSELTGLVESAYHEALNDRRQDGSRVRDLTPYLQQLVIRQSVGGNEDAFTAKGWKGDGPKQYVNAQKVQTLNAAASRLLQKMGKKGGVNDLSNIFYTEALVDWNALGEGVRKQWNRKAQKDENGFYLSAQDMILKGEIG